MFQNPAKANLASCKSLFWGIRCEGGKEYTQVVKQKFHISMAALDPTVRPTSPVVSLIVEREGSHYLLCSLKPDTLMQVNLNLIFDKGDKVTFSVKGHGTVYLSGYHIYSESDDLNSSTNSCSQNIEKQMKGGSPTKKLFISPAQKNKAADVSKTESKDFKVATTVKIATPMKKTAKIKKAESEESSSEDEVSSENEDKKVTTPVKAATPIKKTAKTKKAESEESSSDEVSSDNEDAKNLQKISKKRPIASLEEEQDSDSEDEDDSSDDNDDDFEDDIFKKGIKPLSKKIKTNTSTPMQGKKPAEIIVLEDDDSGKGSKKAESLKKLSDMNSSIGRTPMPKKSASSILQKTNSFNKSKKKKMEEYDESHELDSDVDDSVVMESDLSRSVSQMNATPETPNPKKKKKKKKAADNESILSVNKSDSSKANGNNSNIQYSRKITGGVEYDDIRVGNGPLAVKGKLAHVYYTGRLQSNKLFDSCQAGSKPFSFRIGSGQVIKGWDVGIEGMKVGGKRRLKIPPQLAYKSQRSGPIPPNSTLFFEVELKAVS